MAAKELKPLIEVGTSLGYTGDELKQFINDERMRIDREKAKADERKRQDKEFERAEKERMEKQKNEKEEKELAWAERKKN